MSCLLWQSVLVISARDQSNIQFSDDYLLRLWYVAQYPSLGKTCWITHVFVVVWWLSDSDLTLQSATNLHICLERSHPRQQLSMQCFCPDRQPSALYADLLAASSLIPVCMSLGYIKIFSKLCILQVSLEKYSALAVFVAPASYLPQSELGCPGEVLSNLQLLPPCILWKTCALPEDFAYF